MKKEDILKLENASISHRDRASENKASDPARILNTREKKELLKEMEDHYGIDPEVFRENNFIARSDRIYIASKFNFPSTPKKLTIEGIGMLFARVSATLKLTTNAIQLYGRHATKHILELNKSQLDDYIRGLDIAGFEKEQSGYVIVRYGNDNVGCGLLKDGILKNQIPKQRRIKKL